MPQTSPRQRKTTGRVMHEFKHGELKSGPGGKGGKVKSRRQAVAIAFVQAEGESIRQVLAMHLHDKHERTIQSVQAKAMPEPDSLGG
jgi:hypothetical protein